MFELESRHSIAALWALPEPKFIPSCAWVDSRSMVLPVTVAFIVGADVSPSTSSTLPWMPKPCLAPVIVLLVIEVVRVPPVLLLLSRLNRIPVPLVAEVVLLALLPIVLPEIVPVVVPLLSSRM